MTKTRWITTEEANQVHTVQYNPYTGLPRNELDIQSDPQGVLIVPPGALLRAAKPAQPKLKVVIHSYPESNGKRNWTALITRDHKWNGLIGNGGGITVAHGEYWNRVAYESERARFLIGEREKEPDIIQYGWDVRVPEDWTGSDAESAHGFGGHFEP